MNFYQLRSDEEIAKKKTMKFTATLITIKLRRFFYSNSKGFMFRWNDFKLKLKTKEKNYSH